MKFKITSWPALCQVFHSNIFLSTNYVSLWFFSGSISAILRWSTNESRGWVGPPHFGLNVGCELPAFEHEKVIGHWAETEIRGSINNQNSRSRILRHRTSMTASACVRNLYLPYQRSAKREERCRLCVIVEEICGLIDWRNILRAKLAHLGDGQFGWSHLLLYKCPRAIGVKSNISQANLFMSGTIWLIKFANVTYCLLVSGPE